MSNVFKDDFARPFELQQCRASVCAFDCRDPIGERRHEWLELVAQNCAGYMIKCTSQCEIERNSVDAVTPSEIRHSAVVLVPLARINCSSGAQLAIYADEPGTGVMETCATDTSIWALTADADV